MSASWSAPDGRRVVAGTAFGVPYERVEQVSPPVRQDVLAGLVTVVVTVLAAAPVGLAWGVLSPRVQAERSGADYVRADLSGTAEIAADGFFLAAVLVAGVVTGLLAFRFARDHGPAVVAGLAAGGLAAAWTAMRVGEQLHVASSQAAVRSALPSVELPVSLTAHEALCGWAVAALLVHLVLTLRSD